MERTRFYRRLHKLRPSRLSPSPADLASVVAAWPRLPPHVRDTILTIVRTTCGDEGGHPDALRCYG
jgi:hypothetical protein